MYTPVKCSFMLQRVDGAKMADECGKTCKLRWGATTIQYATGLDGITMSLKIWSKPITSIWKMRLITKLYRAVKMDAMSASSWMTMSIKHTVS
ncbi:hypothetical protein ACT3XG_13420 [Paenibacillus polymyxa]|uniref:hypothetical protein n=2 Tax=Paenibacillus TaxID=44249 RepID=UPI0008D547DB|nr:hypothetical protein [Paenibacillus polymyxa]UBS85164.1 hypothetical protein LAZ93_13395 [Paenibacillus polymyxa]WHX33676.1 hypothetical protein QNH38_13865 [Paenibacillus polymyxa]SEJ79711.1 hypothetical protein SAMN04488600_104418 [Paenibacillus polymyxa]